MVPFAFHDNVLTLLLAGVDVLLTGREAWWLWRGHCVGSDTSAFQYRFCALVASLLVLPVLLCGGSVVGALALGGVMALDSAQGRGIAFQILVPILSLYALFPSFWSVLFLLILLLWPLKRGQGDSILLHFLPILVIGLVVPVLDDGQSVFWLLTLAVFLPCMVFLGRVPLGCLSVYFVTGRLLLLLTVMHVAAQDGLGPGAQAAFTAFLLDLVLHILPFFCARWRCLGMVLPFLPGFVVLWLGLHALFGLAVGAGGWSMTAVVMVVALGGSILLETGQCRLEIRSFGRWDVMLLAFVLPSFTTGLGMVLFPLLSHDLTLNEVFPLRNWWHVLWLIPGGDGALLAWPLLWGLMLMVWLLCVRPWQKRQVISSDLPDEIHWVENPLAAEWGWTLPWRGVWHCLPWMVRRRMVILRRILVQFRQMFILPWWDKAPDADVAMWLVFLGSILAVMGLAL